MKYLLTILILLFSVDTFGKTWFSDSETAEQAQRVQKQQAQYSKVQPVPFYDWSLERDLVIQLYNMRNMKAVTHSVWRSDLGTIEGDCPSIGFGIPYDTSLTSPTAASNESLKGTNVAALATVDQAEPNGLFSSKVTAATWVLCAGNMGTIEPIYVETKVTVYPYSVSVDYDKNRVKKKGIAKIRLKIKDR